MAVVIFAVLKLGYVQQTGKDQGTVGLGDYGPRGSSNGLGTHFP